MYREYYAFRYILTYYSLYFIKWYNTNNYKITFVWNNKLSLNYKS